MNAIRIYCSALYEGANTDMYDIEANVDDCIESLDVDLRYNLDALTLDVDLDVDLRYDLDALTLDVDLDDLTSDVNLLYGLDSLTSGVECIAIIHCPMSASTTAASAQLTSSTPTSNLCR
jgi:hypothetical protein